MKKRQSLIPCLTNVDNGIEKGFEISIYRNGSLMVDGGGSSDEILQFLSNDLKMSTSTITRMVSRMIKNGWTQKRFIDAVDYVESNCTFYPPKPSEFESYDKKIKFNTYSEICDKISLYTAVYCKPISQPMYIEKKHFEEMPFPIWEEKYRRQENVFSDEQMQEMCKKQDDYIRSK